MRWAQGNRRAEIDGIERHVRTTTIIVVVVRGRAGIIIGITWMTGNTGVIHMGSIRARFLVTRRAGFAMTRMMHLRHLVSDQGNHEQHTPDFG